MLHDLIAIALWCFLITSFVVEVAKPKRRSAAAYRRERQFRQAQNAARRYSTLPPMMRVINEEKRWKRARRSALAAVTWALGCGDWSKDEIAGSMVVALRRDKQLVFDHDRLHATCEEILRQATNTA